MTRSGAGHHGGGHHGGYWGRMGYGWGASWYPWYNYYGGCGWGGCGNYGYGYPQQDIVIQVDRDDSEVRRIDCSDPRNYGKKACRRY
jgi:hypothetical protein